MDANIDVHILQDRDISIQSLSSGPFQLRFLYARSADSREADQPGQDYLAFRGDGHRLAFVLCDGVSQSFYGDLAARFLGDALVEWLTGRRPDHPGEPGQVRQGLSDYLYSLTGAANAQVQELTLPEDLPPMIREVLEQKRALGSETTFVCGYLQGPTADIPLGQLVLAWMGDSRLRLWGTEGERTPELEASWDEVQRWSSREGPKGGAPGVFVGTLAGVSCVQAYSDGLLSREGELSPQLEDAALDRLVAALGEEPTSDDISFLQIDYQLGALPRPLPTPSSVVAHLVNERIWASWSAMSGVDRYEVNWVDRAGREKTMLLNKLEWTSPLCILGGKHALRVRGMRGQESGPWSEVLIVDVPRLLPHLAYAANVFLALVALLVGGLLSWWR